MLLDENDMWQAASAYTGTVYYHKAHPNAIPGRQDKVADAQASWSQPEKQHSSPPRHVFLSASEIDTSNWCGGWPGKRGAASSSYCGAMPE